MSALFANRREAGRMLARVLATGTYDRPVILALPRGGVPVAAEIAKVLNAPLDVLFVRKIGAPGHEEYGIGALVDGASPQIIIDRDAARLTGASEQYIQHQVATQLAEIERRRELYQRDAAQSLKGRTVILVDDGIATGGTVRVALEALRQAGSGPIVLAVPVAPPEVVRALSPLCTHIVCLAEPQPFYAVGAHYRDFTQTTDEEVIADLAAARERV